MQDYTSAPTLDNAIALQKYGVGQPVRRKEDDTLVRGSHGRPPSDPLDGPVVIGEKAWARSGWHQTDIAGAIAAALASRNGA